MYDRRAAVYDLWSALTETHAMRMALEWARPMPHESVLEVAVGTGRLFQGLIRRLSLGRPVGVDLSAGMLGRARRRVAKAGGSPCALVRADARALPFRAAAFDLVLNCYMLDLLSRADASVVLKEFRRVAKPGGRLALVVMAEQQRLVNAVWMLFYRATPSLVGGCRPVAARPLLERAGWSVERQEHVSQNAFRSELTLARAAREIAA